MELKDVYFSVFATNGDASIVQNDDEAKEIMKWLNESQIEEVTASEDFDLACCHLDFSPKVPPRKIYRVIHPNPNECGCICFAKDYGD